MNIAPVEENKIQIRAAKAERARRKLLANGLCLELDLDRYDGNEIVQRRDIGATSIVHI
jgi:hypothetical protein